ncbi:hypothetical protein B0H19DRAFT_1238756 [Mycena capillaripes]|nr:hypothetical protein B0H19DRAFT_1238756 [Mycena capillaripes]
MLQIPSSVLALFSSSSKGIVGLLGGLCIGTQVAVNLVLYGSKTEFSVVRATPTIEIVVPTRCVLSNDTLSFPYVAAMGYAIVIFLSLFCILRAKGFASASSSGSVPSPQPPVPPSDPGSNSSADKRRRRCRRIYWLTLLLAALIVQVIRVFLTYYLSRPVPLILHPFYSVGLQAASSVESSLSFLWVSVASSFSALTAHLSLHGRQYRRILLLALASHSVSILLALVFRRVRRHLMMLPGIYWADMIVIGFVPSVVIASIPQLRWIYWMVYYTGAWDELLPGVHKILSLIYRLWYHFSSLVTFQSVDIAMIVAPAVVHAVTMSLWTVVVGLLGIPCTARAVFQDISLPGRFIHYLTFSIGFTALWVIYAVYDALALHLNIMHPHAKEVVWRSFSCPESRAQTRQLFSYFLQRFQIWRSDQINAFPALISGLQDAFKAGFNLIVAPAALFYIYFDIIPAARRLSRIRWRDRQRINGFDEFGGDVGHERQTDGYFDDQKKQERLANDRHRARGNRRGARTGHEDHLGRLTILATSQLPPSPNADVLSVALASLGRRFVSPTSSPFSDRRAQDIPAACCTDTPLLDSDFRPPYTRSWLHPFCIPLACYGFSTGWIYPQIPLA